MWRILLNMRLRLEIVTAEYITEILFRESVFRVHPLCSLHTVYLEF